MEWRGVASLRDGGLESDLRLLDSPVDVVDARQADGLAALGAAMAYHETKHGTMFTVPGIDASMKNPLGLKRQGRFMSFSSWGDAFAEFHRRLTDPTYAEGAYAQTRTLEELIHVWAPSSDGNDERRYRDVVLRKLEDYQEERAMTDRVVIEKNLLAPGAPNNPTTKLDVTAGYVAVTCHQTGNYRAYADARSQIAYIHSADAIALDVAYHLAVDDDRIVQGLTLDRIGWHAADGCDDWTRDVGCFRSIAIEGCVNQGADYRRAILNYAECIARLHLGDPEFDWGDGRARGLVSVDHLFQHIQVAQNFPPHHCPNEILNGQMGYTWKKFLDEVDRAVTRIGDGKPVHDEWGPAIHFVKHKVGHSVKGALSRKEASASSAQVRLYEPGTPLRLVASRQGQKVGDEARWYQISSPGGPSDKAWIHASGIDEVGDQSFDKMVPVTGHAVAGAISRVAASRAAEVVRQYGRRTALRLIGWEEGEEVAGTATWYVIESKGPSNEARIHVSGLQSPPETR